ncbi:hypothetical protein CB0940_09214 [Cercospora beticola]|uniref:Uncharacterized protein n=1 Tax=Cercospora beticola TaxID=122368 RepID=A0A2G5HGG9_CERBT|nr:hypothetical protein CB0940_09214 [Cercospora beticola]PIA91640.1 hypothetical protein CB0940_09214 [Cercospora beticola]WPB06485.1 hypothetical protein RHO25_011142 [Cercospora beticola]
MSGVTNIQNSSAVARVFGTPELLEMILLEVAHSDIEFAKKNSKTRSMYNWRGTVSNGTLEVSHHLTSHFMWTPIILQAVSRCFQDTINGSSRLLRLRLRAIPRHVPWEPDPFKIGDNRGPIHWLERKLGVYAPDWSRINNGVLGLHVKVSGYHEKQRVKLHNDKQGSWRTIPCIEKPGVVSKVVVHLYKVYSKQIPPHRRVGRGAAYAYYRRTLCSCDIGPRPTLGEIFDVIDAAESLYCSFPLICKEGGAKCQC